MPGADQGRIHKEEKRRMAGPRGCRRKRDRQIEIFLIFVYVRKKECEREKESKRTQVGGGSGRAVSGKLTFFIAFFFPYDRLGVFFDLICILFVKFALGAFYIRLLHRRLAPARRWQRRKRRWELLLVCLSQFSIFEMLSHLSRWYFQYFIATVSSIETKLKTDLMKSNFTSA